MRILNHINIVTLFAIIFELGHYGIVMEYVLHGALDNFMFNYDVRCSVCDLNVHVLTCRNATFIKSSN